MAKITDTPQTNAYSSGVKKVLVLGEDGQSMAADSNPLPIKISDFEGDMDVNVESNSVSLSGLIGKTNGDADFTVAYASATTLTISGLPDSVSGITNEDIVSITQIKSDGSVTKTFYRDDSTITVSGSTITVADASFNATDSFVIYTNIQDTSSGGSASVVAEYTSPSDFSATYTSSSTITLSGLPFTIYDSSQIVYVKIIPVSGAAQIYVNGSNEITMTVSSNILTISGASPFVSGDVYEVGINSQKKAYDPSTNSQMTSNLNPLWERYTDAEELVAAQDLTSSYADFGSEIDMRGYNTLGVFIVEDVNDSQDVDLKLFAKDEFGGTDEYDIDSIPVERLWSGTGTDAKKYYQFDTDSIPIIQIQAKAGTVGSTAGNLTLKIVKMWM